MVMKSYRKEIYFNINARRGFVNITPQIEQCLRESGINEGMLLCNAMHITTSVFVNDDESGLHEDMEKLYHFYSILTSRNRDIAGQSHKKVKRAERSGEKC